MAVLYSVDFRTLPNQTFGNTPGAHEIDGLEWWAKGIINLPGSNNFETRIVNGSGLLFVDTNNSGAPGVGTNGELTKRHMVLPMANVPGWTSGLSYMIRARFSYVTSPHLNKVNIGIVNTTSDAANLQASQRAGDFLVGPSPSATTTNFLQVKLGGAADSDYTGRAGTIANGECVVGLYHFTPRFACPGSEHLASGMPTDPSSWLAVTTLAVQDYNGLRANPCLLYTAGNSTGSTNCYLQQLRIETLGELLDVTAPEITNISPAPGALGIHQPISFGLTDDSGLIALREFWIRFGAGNIYEQVHDGTQFLGRYTRSSITAITSGYALSIVRDGGWIPGTVALRAVVLDAGGNLVVVNA